MSDTAEGKEPTGDKGGSEGSGNPAPVTLDNSTPSGQDGKGGGAKSEPAKTPASPGNDPFAALSQENRELVTKKGWKSLDDAVKSYGELEKQFSTRTPSGSRVGSPSEYDFKRPDGLPAGATYDEAFANAFRQGAFAAELDKETAAKVHDWYVSHASTALAAQAEAMSAQIGSAATALEKAWGKQGTEMFGRQLELARRAMSQLGLADAMKSVGAIRDVDGRPTVFNPEFMTALAKVGGALFSEDTVYGDINGGPNPFAKDTENLAMQSRVMQEAPDKAEQLIRLAGKYAMDIYGPWLRQREGMRRT